MNTTAGLVLMVETGLDDRIEVPEEMFDFLKVLQAGVDKGYAPNNWLHADGKNCEHKLMYASIFRHIADAYGKKKVDESGLDPRLHAATRLLMDYVRDKIGVKKDG